MNGWLRPITKKQKMAKTKLDEVEQKFFMTRQGYKISYLIKRFNNKKPFIYFQHGLTGNHTVWKTHMHYMLEKEQPFIIIDLLGHGNSDKPMGKKCYTIENHGDYLLQVLEHEKIKGHIMVGQCLGAMIGLYNEMFRQDRCKSKALVLLGTPLRNPTKFFIHQKAEPLTPLFRIIVYLFGIIGTIFGRRKFYPLVDYTKHKNDSRIWIFMLDMLGTPKAAYFWTINSMIDTNLVPYLDRIKKPVLLVYGESDFNWMQESYTQMRENFKNTNVVILKRVDHLVTMRAPIELSKEIIKFAKELKMQ